MTLSRLGCWAWHRWVEVRGQWHAQTPMPQRAAPCLAVMVWLRERSLRGPRICLLVRHLTEKPVMLLALTWTVGVPVLLSGSPQGPPDDV